MAEIPFVLIADAQAPVREVGIGLAQSLGYDAEGCGNSSELFQKLGRRAPDLLVLDADLPEQGGLAALAEVKAQYPALPILIVTASATVAQAVGAMKAGAAEFLAKPFEGEEFRSLLKSLMRPPAAGPGAAGNKLEMRRRAQHQSLEGDLIGTGAAMQKVFRLVAKVAPNRYPVLVLGESGTGKEMVARAIHFAGPDREHPFLPVDCGTLVPTLIESELFGYVRGAFTGAEANRDGLLKSAQGGTVFLDEIAELSLDLQIKLLRAIQEREFRPVGGTKRLRLEARIIAATNRNLEEAVREGTFRKDLFFRLNVVSIKLPPLRERGEDIPYLIAHFLDKLNAAAGSNKRFDERAWKALLSYTWPGNVRELENCIERCTAVSSGPVMTLADLPSPVRLHVEESQAAATQNGVRALAEMERDAIFHALSVYHDDKLLAAKKLGIGKTTLYRKLKEYQMSA
ncbi:MAG TPA: sigma-54 dependent transcriptional regulator [Terriglobales bacterium]|nr:sigma-54 dependent transcriptional regulator [Terriglobales bacterium]